MTVGLDSVDGTAITPGNYPVQDTSGNVLPFGGVPVGSSILTLGFNNFTPGSQLEYSLAHGGYRSWEHAVRGRPAPISPGKRDGYRDLG